MGRSASAFVFAGDDANMAAAFERHARNVGRSDRLVARCRRLVSLGQVHPKLHHVHSTTTPGELLLVVLLVKDARCRRHPLNVARTDDAGVARVVAMSDGAFPRESDRLEAAMGMPPDAALAAIEGRKFLRRSVVHQDEGADALRSQVGTRKVGRHVKAVADPVKRRAVVDGFNAPSFGLGVGVRKGLGGNHGGYPPT